MASDQHKDSHNKNSLEPVVVFVVPFPAQGHLNQLLQFSCLISSYGLPVHIVGFKTHIHQAKSRNFQDLNKIHFHEFPTPHFDSPPPIIPTSITKFPTHLQPSFEASKKLREPFTNLLHEFSNKVRRLVVIHDPLMSSVVQDFSTIPNAESYAFNCISPFTHFFTFWDAIGRPFQVEGMPKVIPSMEGCLSFEIMNFMAYQYELMHNRTGDLFNSCRLIEGTYIDLLNKIEMNANNKQWSIGPILPDLTTLPRASTSRHESLEWLDKQGPKSVLYISFGSSTTLTDEQIQELAMGLENSKKKFLWVLRDADKGNVFDGETRKARLPEGYQERTEGKGIVVTDWAPQLEILGHSSVGGFMSHCGWNSCMESITMGVPILAWPMHSEQPWNATLITDILEIGIQVTEQAHQMELVDSSTIEKAVNRLMVSKEGEEMRSRAEKLGKQVWQSRDEGGVSQLELNSFIAHLRR
ncbi:Zeatin O-xylosyltransferase [Capsicum annuum]|uniref:zeatin O-glucosyltransferase n=1 Tax=Capsicum annuum TaxID=4072 RepID=UPI001FB08552|nr:zeatin O-glucosyltransferase [Capsicum annuum]KAF3613795.1 Zeatin O-xylosyltransferase [Capsicum annuum]KAF3670566.1 Zeatin O-xylosyltransferase [Capsicum annuum]